MSNRISDCPPLLPAGEHVRSVEEIRDLCVSNFSLSTTRKAIMDGFLKIVEMLEAERVVCELVVDGSFLTEEIDPDDIDFAVVVTPQFYDACTASQRKLLDWIGDDKGLRAHICVTAICALTINRAIPSGLKESVIVLGGFGSTPRVSW
jgi:hypothetical protein